MARLFTVVLAAPAAAPRGRRSHQTSSTRTGTTSTTMRPMSAPSPEQPKGHVFVSYVRDDTGRVDRLTKLLTDAGIEVWRDRDKLWPGQDWRHEIQKAIEHNSLAFLACFSANSEGRGRTYQRQEIRLAIEQMQRLQPFTTWLIPVRFDECTLPQYSLGPGQNLGDIHRVDLFDDDWSEADRLVETILRVLGDAAPPPDAPEVLTQSSIYIEGSHNSIITGTQSVEQSLESLLLDPTKEIQLDKLINGTVALARQRLADVEVYPPSSNVLNEPDAAMEFIQQQIFSYVDDVRDAATMVMQGCAYGTTEQQQTWTKVVERLSRVANQQLGGHTVLLNLRNIPLIATVFAGALGAVHRSKYGALRAITTDAVHDNATRREPMIGAVHPLIPFEQHGDIANLAVENAERKAKGDELLIKATKELKTPQSDFFNKILWPIFAEMFSADEREYDDTFDRAEVLLALTAEHQSNVAKTEGAYVHEGWVGRFIWRRRSAASAADLIFEEFEQVRDKWRPLQAGLLGGLNEAELAIESYKQKISDPSSRFWP